MTPDDPRHGTNAGATAHWYENNEKPCAACTAAKAKGNKAALVDRLAGRERTVTLGEPGHQLLSRTPVVEAERLTGLSQFTIRRLIADGPDARMRRDSKDRLLALRSATRWTGIGLQRRVQALHAIGWTCAAIARESGVCVEAVQQLRDRAPKQPRRTQALAIIAAYDALSMQLPPSETQRQQQTATKSRRRAEAGGWLPPLAWDDIDNPDEIPVTASRPGRVGRPEVLSEHVEDFTWLVSQGESADHAAARVGVRLDSLRDQRTRAAREAS